MEKKNVALQLYSVRNDAKRDFYGTLKAVKEMGYDGVEFAGLYEQTPGEIRDMCREVGLVPVAAHLPLAETMAQLEEILDYYQAVGCKYVGIPYLPEEYRPGKEKFEEILAFIRKIGEAAKSRGMVLQYHNHDFEFVKVGDRYGLDMIYEEVEADLLKAQLDTCWVAVGGEDPAAYLRKYAGRFFTVHLKDYEIDDAGEVKLKHLGGGRQDFKSIVEASLEGGAKWLIVEQDWPSKGYTPMECAKLSIDYLTELLAGF